MIRLFRTWLLVFSPLWFMVATNAAFAWPVIQPWHSGRYEVSPSVYGYPLDDAGAGYYGGGRYKEYYSFGRGYALADFPGPVPNYPQGHWFKPSYWPYGSQKLPGVYEPELNQNCATIIMQVPPNAQVWLEGQPTKQTGTTRTFISPKLTPKQNYTYAVSAKWNNGTGMVYETKNVVVQAGKLVQVNFSPPSQTEQVSFTPKFQPAPNK